MKIWVTGATGLIGSRVVQALEARGDEAVRITRGPSEPPRTVHWDPDGDEIEASIDDVDGIIHLAGENIAAGRWTAAQRRRLLESRVKGTSLLARRLAEHTAKSISFVSASAIGIYGDRGPDWVDEAAAPGDLFLSEICVAWESAADPAKQAGHRVVHPRIGVVLSREGGALGKMLLPFQLGLGGPVGSGAQYISWVTLDDVVAMLLFCLDRPEVEGPVNLVGPEPARQRDFARALGRTLGRPAVLPVPAFGIRALFGQMGRELLLSSTRASSKKIESLGYRFRHASLDAALKATLTTSES
jgi:uncharacterized protein (TIGR01777 family)